MLFISFREALPWLDSTRSSSLDAESVIVFGEIDHLIKRRLRDL
jgi:hypothetical protein